MNLPRFNPILNLDWWSNLRHLRFKFWQRLDCLMEILALKSSETERKISWYFILIFWLFFAVIPLRIPAIPIWRDILAKKSSKNGWKFSAKIFRIKDKLRRHFSYYAVRERGGQNSVSKLIDDWILPGKCNYTLLNAIRV